MNKNYIVASFTFILFFFFFDNYHGLAQEKLNILFLFTDDQRADAVGAYGNAYIQTPNIDKLADAGTRFTNAFCMGSHHGAVCMPSRAMLMSGKSLYRVYDNLEGVTTLPMVLKNSGYVTFGTGKWHNGREPFKAGFTNGKNIFFGGMSDHFNVPIVDLKKDGTYSEVEKKSFSTDLFGSAAVEFIEEYAKGDQSKPFFAYVSFSAPHDPRSPAPDYINAYDPAALPLPPDFKDKHPFDLGIMTIRDENLGAWPRSPEQIRMQMADYYALIEHIDDQVGRIIKSLNDHGLSDNTIIIFSSDHGLAIGSHGLLGKQNLYEPSMRSPLIISGPGIPASNVTDAFTYLHDIFPTLCGMLNINIPEGVDGKDLTPVIFGEIKEVRSSLFTTYSNSQRAVKDHRWKLIQYPQIHYTQLFDLQNDPYELNNLAGDPFYKAKVEDMMQRLKEWQQKTGDEQPLFAEEKKPMDYDLTGRERKPDRHQPDYTLEKYFKE